MKSILSTILILLLFIQVVLAQARIVGSVADDKDQPLAGANVLIKGKVTGTVTGADGSFQLNTSVAPPLTLVISMVGYVRHEVEVADAGSDRKSTRLNSSHVKISYAV